MTINPLALHLKLTWPWITPLAWVDTFLVFTTLAIAIVTLWRKPNAILRPAFMLAALVIVFYQLPMTLYAPVLAAHLPGANLYAFAVHGIVTILLFWVYFTPDFTVTSLYSSEAFFTRRQLFGAVMLLTLLVIIYLAAVPFECTALYATLIEPNIAGLARELSVKLVGTTAATYAFGIVVNVMVPIVGFLALWQGYRACQTHRWLSVLLWFLVLFIALGCTLLGGAKGNLVPAFITMLVAGFLLASCWRWRIVNTIAILGVLALFLIIYQAVGERKAETGKYPFGYCVVAVNACNETQILLDSLRLRDLSLGLDKWRIDQLEAELQRSCAGKMSGERFVMPNAGKMRLTGTRFGQLLEATLYRAFVLPFQLSVWHQLYVVEHGSPGKYALPRAQLWFGKSAEMPQKVYQEYGAIFSDGDRTSTSTSPTSYLLAYPIYWGVVGLSAALILSLLFDLAAAWIIRESKGPARFLFIGLITVTILNFIVSDFFTVMLSHGAAAALALGAGFVWFQRKS